VQYPVIYAGFSNFNSSSILLSWWKAVRRRKKSEDRRLAHFGDLPVWYFSHTLQWS